jgi:Domain of unknown function (DUF4167)
MRQGQQNRRGRGRNRKSQNPLTRSFESNGPDVKIRGTPAHIAEKYVSMARDALSSGDPVLAENYLQHAEHYNRIIMSYREQQSQMGEGSHSGQGRPRDSLDEAGDSDGDDALNGHADALPRGHGPQPTIGGEDNPEPRNNRRSNGHDNDRRRQPQASSDQGEDDGESMGERRPRRRERYAQRDDQPDFLKRPIRKPRRPSTNDANGESNGGDDDDSSAADGGAEADNAA